MEMHALLVELVVLRVQALILVLNVNLDMVKNLML